MFELKSLDQKERNHNRLNAALNIYRETILQEAQNPERQILYWLEHSKDNLSDEFKCFAIQSRREVTGYLQYSYFREEHLFFFEYLCIRDFERKGLLPSEAVKNVEAFLAQNYDPGFMIVFEVAHIRDAKDNWVPDRKLMKYFKRLGFRSINFSYRYPVLQTYTGEVSYPADLMIWLPDRRTDVKSFELRTILRCIYFKHYLRWDRPFLKPELFRERERLINQLYSEQVAQISGDDTLGTSGDSKRLQMDHFARLHPRIIALLDRIFGPKLLRISMVIGLMLVAQWIIGGTWLLLPFVLAVAAVYCLAEDTDASRKLFIVILSRFRSVRPRPL